MRTKKGAIMSKTCCTIREDLQKDCLSIPVGNEMIEGNENYAYRWINSEDEFQIKLNGKWLEACSIDFDFE